MSIARERTVSVIRGCIRNSIGNPFVACILSSPATARAPVVLRGCRWLVLRVWVVGAPGLCVAGAPCLWVAGAPGLCVAGAPGLWVAGAPGLYVAGAPGLYVVDAPSFVGGWCSGFCGWLVLRVLWVY